MAGNLYGLKKYIRSAGKLACCGNFQYVLDGKLARGSQPNYMSGDKEHSVTEIDVQQFKQQRIGCIISANHCRMDDNGKRRLGKAGIGFFHFKVVDFAAPAPAQLQKAANVIELFSRRGATLVYCGFGQGRTGSFIAAWAMLRYMKSLAGDIDEMCRESFLKSNFGVENLKQTNAVREAAGLPALTGTGPTPGSLPPPGSSASWTPPAMAGSGASWTPPAMAGSGASWTPPAMAGSGASWTPPAMAGSGASWTPPPLPDLSSGDSWTPPAAMFSTGSAPPLPPSPAPLPKVPASGRGPSGLGFPDDDNFGML
ncbi:hypothetical protein FKG94_27310 [Exilibacterium tricleocarpae]|uniref:Tyrosine specific protein phosphatases domain-containing protein n=1 Tax=Exilibacterium tricleocarpae TaxID=2591008 RepID=A0A545SMX0_9GAMM|nr:dual specificity protein phosphatase family protein [Exilibacterium tricleocarpae]TQV66304.1 hypothetical protein FKG94_27310 [Exilibacterium tricleocarpae]